MKPRMIRFWVGVSLLLLPVPSLAGGRFIQSEFLTVGARYAGMGGGHVALPGGVSSAYYNPALLPWENRLEFAVEGSYTHDPAFEANGGESKLTHHDRGNFSLVGVRLPDLRGFSFVLLETTRYDHDIRGYLFGRPPGGGTKPLPKTADNSTIQTYEDRATINSFGLGVGYKTSPNTSVGLSFWVDRKKVFKERDYEGSRYDPTQEAIDNNWFDAEATTNDVSIRLAGGMYHRLSDRIDLGVGFTTGSDLTSVLQIDQWVEDGLTQADSTATEKTPWVVQGGASYYWSRTLRFAGDLTYQHWGSQENKKSVVQIGLGSEWEQSPRLVLRGGFCTSFDPGDREDDEAYAEALRDLGESGNLYPSDEYFLTFGAGYRLRPYLQLDGSVANSDLLSPEDGRTDIRFAVRFLVDPDREEGM